MNKHTPYYHRWAALGAKFQDRGGFATVNFLTSIEDEHRTVRERVGIFDVGYQVGIEIKGSDAETVLQRALVNDVRRLRDGTALYSTICEEGGGVVDDLTCFRFDANRFWVSPSPSRVSAVTTFLESLAAEFHATVTNLGLSNAYLSIQGPHSRDVLAALTDADISTTALPFFSFTHGRIAEVPRSVISRTGFSGELGYELFFPVEYAEHVWDAVMAAGQAYDVQACGMKTMRSLRIEKMYLLYGLDITTDTDPLSAGLGWTVRFDDRQYSGRGALEAIAASGPERQLCLLETEGFHPIVHGESIRVGHTIVSMVTSGDPGYTLGNTYALAYLPMEFAQANTSVEILLKDQLKPVPARVLTRAPYDPERRRLTV
jgi:aminomethyltransferase